MNLLTKPMNHHRAVQIAGWAYDPPYDFYNIGDTQESVAELLNGAYSAVCSVDNELVGFFCIGESAQVPAGHKHGAYVDGGRSVVDLGIGMRPNLTGRGMGTPFLAYVLREVGACQPTADIRLTVATFNQRAIKLYRRFGFRHQTQFDRDGVTFRTMRRPADCAVFLRRAQPDDEQYMREWLRDSTDCMWVIGHTPFRHEDYLSWLEASEQRMWILDSEVGPVGYGEVWVDEDGADTELAHLVIAPNHRGHGFGRILVELLYDEASYCGFPWVYMRVHPDNHRALACYRRAGFEVMEQISADWPTEYVWVRRAALTAVGRGSQERCT
jgi:[ribosomal protein S18]-alanine N-acetyltransferase